MAIVVFNSAEFLEIYPRFVGVLTPAQLTNAFDCSCLLLDNSDGSVVPYDPDNGVNDRKTLLYALTCHLCEMALTNAVWAILLAGYSQICNWRSICSSEILPSMGISNGIH